MKRGFFCCLFAFVAAVTFTQDMDIARTAHYEVISDGNDGANLAREMEERFVVYNRLFRFDQTALSAPLRVRSFGDTQAYNSYVAARADSVPPGAAYLHYREREKRELAVNRNGGEENWALPYQAFLQFLRAFVSDPPAWMREGFAVYFSDLDRAGSERPSFRENLSWLEAVKNMKDPPDPIAILLTGGGETPRNFQGLSWALVSFFLNGGTEYTRTLTDSFMALEDRENAAENAGAVVRQIGRWNNMDNLAGDFRNYINSRKTFAELVDEGEKAYTAGDKAGAKLAFAGALDQKANHYAPHYYLGLLAYEEGDYAAAEKRYFDSMAHGADHALVFYALGLNAAAGGKTGDALDYLRRAAEVSPDRYREKAGNIISRLTPRESAD
jgi:tetratricopeptide (TPR) repeat protein